MTTDHDAATLLSAIESGFNRDVLNSVMSVAQRKLAGKSSLSDMSQAQRIWMRVQTHAASIYDVTSANADADVKAVKGFLSELCGKAPLTSCAVERARWITLWKQALGRGTPMKKVMTEVRQVYRDVREEDLA